MGSVVAGDADREAEGQSFCRHGDAGDGDGGADDGGIGCDAYEWSYVRMT